MNGQKKYFIYSVKSGLAYGHYVYISEDIEKAKEVAIAFKKATGYEYGVFERATWCTYD